MKKFKKLFCVVTASAGLSFSSSVNAKFGETRNLGAFKIDGSNNESKFQFGNIDSPQRMEFKIINTLKVPTKISIYMPDLVGQVTLTQGCKAILAPGESCNAAITWEVQHVFDVPLEGCDWLTCGEEFLIESQVEQTLSEKEVWVWGQCHNLHRKPIECRP